MPTCHDANVPWNYNSSFYEVERSGLKLGVELQPSCRDIRIVLEAQGNRFYEFVAEFVADVQYRNDSGRETLTIVVDDHQQLFLEVNPRILIEYNGKYE